MSSIRKNWKIVTLLAYALLSLMITPYATNATLQERGPRSEGLDFYFRSGPNTMNLLFLDLTLGDIDVLPYSLTSDEMPYDALGAVIDDPNILLAPYRANDMVQLDINNNEEIPTYPGVTSPTSYVGFRQAIAFLTDKERFLYEILSGYADRIDVPIPYLQRIWWNESVVGTNYPYTYSLTRASETLDAAGFSATGTYETVPGVTVRVYPPGHEKAGEDLDPIILCALKEGTAKYHVGCHLRDMLKSIGVPVDYWYAYGDELVPVIEEKVKEHRDYHIFVGSWTLPRHPTYLYQLYHSDFWYPWGSNYVVPSGKYPALDETLENLYYATSIEQAVESCKKAQSILVNECISVWLWSSNTFQAYRKPLVGVASMEGQGIINDYTLMNAYRAYGEPIIKVGIKAPYPSSFNVMNTFLDDSSRMCLNTIYASLLSVDPYNLARISLG